MNKKPLWWLICKIWGLTVIYTGYVTVVTTLIYSAFHEGRVTITTNTYGELALELFIMITGGILYLVTIIKEVK